MGKKPIKKKTQLKSLPERTEWQSLTTENVAHS